MKHKTRALTLHYIEYAEHSIIASVYTSLFGLQRYLVRGIRKSTPPKGMYISYFQALTPLSLIVEHRVQRSLHYIREVELLYSYQTLFFDVEKRGYASFFAHILLQVSESYDDACEQPCFDFVLRSLKYYDTYKGQSLSFAVQFLVKLTYFLGIALPYTSIDPYISRHYPCDLGTLTEYLQASYQCSYERPPQVTKSLGAGALSTLLNYYVKHFSSSASVRVLQIFLKDILSH